MQNDCYELMLTLVVPLKSKEMSNSLCTKGKTFPLYLVNASSFSVSQSPSQKERYGSVFMMADYLITLAGQVSTIGSWADQ